MKIRVPARRSHGDLEPKSVGGDEATAGWRRRLVVRTGSVFGLCAVLGLSGLLLPATADAATSTHGRVTSTVYFNRAETLDLASAGPVGAGVCWAGVTKIPVVGVPVGVICGAELSFASIQAIRARNRGMCVKLKYTNVTPPGLPVPPHWWDIYDGKYCK